MFEKRYFQLLTAPKTPEATDVAGLNKPLIFQLNVKNS
jgi:hypothetical protein